VTNSNNLNSRLSLLVMSYGLERILEDHDIEQEWVLRYLIDEDMIDIEEYFEDVITTRTN